MGSILSCAAAGVTWCFCGACSSLLSACCGNDKASTIPPSATSGRRRSVLLLFLSIAIAFLFQYGVAPRLQDIVIGNPVVDAWTDGCDHLETLALQEQCAGNAGVYRAAFSATLFFALATVAVLLKPTANREAWPAKYILFLFLCLITCFIPNEPLFLDVYLNIARIGAIFFIFLEQLILIDIAYNWNDSWVVKADAAEAEEPGSGQKWLGAILVSCAILFLGAIAGIAVLFHFFTGCDTNLAFMVVTVIMSVLIVVAQMSGDEGSLLGSAVITAWATYLCYTAVSKNPNEECNPTLGEEDVLGIILGIAVTLMSLAWTGWSYTAESRLEPNGNDGQEDLAAQDHTPKEERRAVTGIVANYGSEQDGEVPSTMERGDEEETAEVATTGLSNSWKLNVVLGVVSCWFAMTLTGWGSIESGGNAANPNVSEVSMWIVIASQWLVLSLYLWTLVAPRLFPDRDFS